MDRIMEQLRAYRPWNEQEEADCAELLRRLHALDEPLREVMYLRAFGALSFREIGDILGRTENWARVTFYRGKERLKKEMIPDEN